MEAQKWNDNIVDYYTPSFDRWEMKWLIKYTYRAVAAALASLRHLYVLTKNTFFKKLVTAALK